MRDYATRADKGLARKPPPVRIRFLLAACAIALLAWLMPSHSPLKEFTVTKLERK